MSTAPGPGQHPQHPHDDKGEYTDKQNSGGGRDGDAEAGSREYVDKDVPATPVHDGTTGPDGTTGHDGTTGDEGTTVPDDTGEFEDKDVDVDRRPPPAEGGYTDTAG